MDDGLAIRQMLSQALEEAGFKASSFARATEFEASLKSRTPDVCLVDLGLPDKDGLVLVHRLALESGARISLLQMGCLRAVMHRQGHSSKVIKMLNSNTKRDSSYGI